MSLKAAFLTLLLLGFCMVLTSKLSSSTGKKLSAEEQHRTYGEEILSSASATVTTTTRTTAPPPSPSNEPTTPAPVTRGAASPSPSSSSSANIILPAIPFSSQEARMKTFRLVQQQQNTPYIKRVIDEHNRICSTKDKKQRVEEFKKKLRQRIEDRNKKATASTASSGVKNIFKFVVFNLFSNDDNTKYGKEQIQPIAGHHRVLIALAWNDKGSDNEEGGDDQGQRVCVGGAVIEGSLSSATDKIDIDYFVDVVAGDDTNNDNDSNENNSNGLYEIQPFFRRSSTNYQLCLSLNALNPEYKWRITSSLSSSSTSSRKTEKQQQMFSSSSVIEYYSKNLDTPGFPDYCIRQSYKNRQCFSLSTSTRMMDDKKLLAIDQILHQQREKGGVCRDWQKLTRGNGAWMKLKSCSDNNDISNKNYYCVGNPKDAYYDSNPLTRQQNNINSNNNNINNNRNENTSTSPTSDDSSWWIFVSDRCLVRIYDRKEAWRISNKHWFLFWGASTLKQPAANFLEYNLGVPVFGAKYFMENLESIKVPSKKSGGGGGGAKRPGFFSYRQYDVTKRQQQLSQQPPSAPVAALRSTMCWGGCPNIVAAPNCNEAMGMNNRKSCAAGALELKSSPSPAASQSTNMIYQYPSVIVLNHFVWRFPLYNITKFLEQVQDTMNWLEDTICENVHRAKNNSSSSSSDSSSSSSSTLSAPPSQQQQTILPTLIWIGGVRHIYEDEDSGMCRNEDTRVFWRMLNWKLDEFFERYISEFNKAKKKSARCSRSPPGQQQQRQQVFSDIHFVARHELTSPLHYSGATFGHFGVHYGATTGMCLTGVSRSDKYGLEKCWRNTAADWMLIQWWLNLLDPKFKKLN